jgi:uncharacterized membrane protein
MDSDYASLLLIYALIILIVSLFVCILCGKAAESMASQKGYENTRLYFWLGFFFSVIGIIVAACLTDKNAIPNAPRTSSADEIRKLKELLDMGAITQDEFDMKKQELLNQ